MESKIAEINALMRKMGSGELSAIAFDSEDHITAENIPKEVRSAVSRAVYGVLRRRSPENLV